MRKIMIKPSKGFKLSILSTVIIGLISSPCFSAVASNFISQSEYNNVSGLFSIVQANSHSYNNIKINSTLYVEEGNRPNVILGINTRKSTIDVNGDVSISIKTTPLNTNHHPGSRSEIDGIYISNGKFSANNFKINGIYDSVSYAAKGVHITNEGANSFICNNLTIQNINSVTSSGLEIKKDEFSPLVLDINGITKINNITGEDYAAGIVIRTSSSSPVEFNNFVEVSNISAVTPADPNGRAHGIQADNVIFNNGLSIRSISGLKPFAIYSEPTQNEGIIIKESNRNVVDGDIYLEVLSKINATFSHDGSYFKGYIYRNILDDFSTTSSERYGGDDLPEGVIHLTFKDKAKWIVTKTSRVNSLTMDGGILETTVDLAPNAAPSHQVTAMEFASGTFDVVLNINNADLWNSDSNRSLNWILQQESGTLSLNDNIAFKPGAAKKFSVAFYEEGADPTTEGLTTSTGNKGQWYVVPVPDTGNTENPDKPPVTDEVDQVLSLGTSLTQAVGMLSETEDLRMRMGDVRLGDTDGLWVRTYSRKDSARGSFGNGFEQDVHGFHIGADHVIRTNSNASWLLGGAFHYGKSDIEGAAEAGGGDADIDQYTFKAYATYMKDNGAFADIVLHTGYYDTTLTGKDNTGMGSFKADYSNWGYGVSAEVGHRFDLSNLANSWYVEPTAQLTWFHAEGKNFKTSTGLEINQGDADFITGRLGAAVGKVFALGTANDPMSSYFSVAMKGGMLYQFDGDQTIIAHGTDGATVVCADAMDMKGARAYYGITADWKIDDTWRVYGQISREEGSGYTKDYDASIGVRYAF